LKLTVVLRENEGRGHSAQCPELTGCITEGETGEEALANIREAIEGYLEAFPEELDHLKRKRELRDNCLRSCRPFLGVKSLRL